MPEGDELRSLKSKRHGAIAQGSCKCADAFVDVRPVFDWVVHRPSKVPSGLAYIDDRDAHSVLVPENLLYGKSRRLGGKRLTVYQLPGGAFDLL